MEEGSYLFIMNLQVLLKVGTRSELLVTDLADVRFLASVDTLMSDQVRDLYRVDASYSRYEYSCISRSTDFCANYLLKRKPNRIPDAHIDMVSFCRGLWRAFAERSTV
jgi:hypothetical protein